MLINDNVNKCLYKSLFLFWVIHYHGNILYNKIGHREKSLRNPNLEYVSVFIEYFSK